LGLGVDPRVLGRRGNDRAIDPDSFLPDCDLDPAQTLSKKTGVGAGSNGLWSLDDKPQYLEAAESEVRGSSSAAATRGNVGWLGELLSLVLGVWVPPRQLADFLRTTSGTPLTSGRLALR
jgi:hypothetical protein